jgi:hypothetical protein
MRSALISLAAMTLIAFPALAVAAPLTQQINTTNQGGSAVTLSSLERFINDAFTICVRVAALAVVGGLAYAGFLMATAGGNPEKFKKAKETLKQVIYGAIVIFGIGVIVNTIANFAASPTQILR